jgi:hypothetical protein
MKYTMLAALTALVVGVAATAHAENAQPLAGAAQPARSGASTELVSSKADPGAMSSAASLNALLVEWDRAGFNPPSKPGQYRVYGRNGYVTTGPSYDAMVSLIRTAVSDARQGREQDAAIYIARARGLLASIAPSTPTHANG